MSEALEEVVVQATPSLGERLRQAREAKKYTVAEVATQLRLPRDIVSYMETQQWDKLNGRTYARGYFASYVKFLGLPFDEMLAVFNLDYTAAEPPLNLMPPSPEQLPKTIPWLMYSLIAGVILIFGLAFLQWQKSQAIQLSALSQSEQIETINELNDDEVAPLTAQLNVSDTDSNEETAQLTTAEAQTVSAESLGMTEDSLEEITETEAVSTNSEVSDELTVPAVAATTDEQLEETFAQTESILKMSFSGECWVEVTNADSQVLVSKVMQAEQSLLLKSDQPLNVLLGHAKVAAVTFNNESVDLTPYIDGNIARLTLGVES